MGAYFKAVGAEMKKSWINAIFVIVFTIGRIIFGWAWLNAGIEKFGWLTDGKFNSGGLISGLVSNLVGPKVTRFDPLGLNHLYGWIANSIFIPRAGKLESVSCDSAISCLSAYMVSGYSSRGFYKAQ